MPYAIKKEDGSKPWKTTKPSGKVVGSSRSKAMAQASVNARYAAKSGYRMKNK